MSYAIVEPPFTLNFPEMSKQDLRGYATWFHEIAPRRLAELAAEVRRTDGYESWEPDATPDSLQPLGDWFEKQVETRERNFEEMAEKRSELTFPIDVPKYDLTNRTFSLAMDIGCISPLSSFRTFRAPNGISPSGARSLPTTANLCSEVSVRWC
jgi:hypothetical protein